MAPAGAQVDAEVSADAPPPTHANVEEVDARAAVPAAIPVNGNGRTVANANGHIDWTEMLSLSQSAQPFNVVDFTIGMHGVLGEMHRLACTIANSAEAARALELHKARASVVFRSQIGGVIAELVKCKAVFEEPDSPA